MGARTSRSTAHHHRAPTVSARAVRTGKRSDVRTATSRGRDPDGPIVSHAPRARTQNGREPRPGEDPPARG
ncbi:hypothetical protein, partial [Streptomyces sp. NPDC054987]